MEAILSLGSNLGDRLANLTQAREAVGHLPTTRLLAASHIYATEPVTEPGTPPGGPYLNAIIIVATRLDLHNFAIRLHAIEAQLGRQRTAQRYAPRLIDIDLICFGSLILNTPELQLPHPRAHQRRFVCAPLCELRPDLLLPGQKLPIRTLLVGLPSTPAATLAAEQWASDTPRETSTSRREIAK
jgi:2-amino-4-hydroxy-6-hydroxymethyldihydropteridine diphosphokinase